MSKKNLLAYHLDPYEEAFMFQVVEQSDQVTSFLKRVGIYEASNGWRVTIDRQPEIDLKNKVVFLQGSKSRKDGYMHRNQNVGSNKERNKILSAIDRALSDLVRDAKCGTRRPFKFYDQMVIDLREFDYFPFCKHSDNRVIIIK